MASLSRLLAEYLIERNVLSRDAAEAAVAEETATGVPFAKLVISGGLVGERDLVAAMAHQIDVPFWDPQLQPVMPAVEGMIPAPVARRHRLVAVGLDRDTLLVAMENTADADAVATVERVTGWQVRPLLAAAGDISAALVSSYPAEPSDSQVGPEPEPPKLHLNALLAQMVKLGASDLHLTVGLPPTLRIDGTVTPMEGMQPLNGSEVRELVYGILSQRQRERFESERELDMSHSVADVGRFRVNVYLQRNSVGAALRAIPYKILSLEQLGVPTILGELAKLPRGLILVTGPTGSGKSTTLAAMVDLINSTRALHIMSVEDPIEFLHNHKRSVVNQREVGEDTRSFSSALKHVLRQDPDVILVGEMRDLETISAAITAAETGHLVFGTLHTQDAPQAVDRIIDVFPAHQQQQIRVQLAAALQGVVTQQLLPRHRVKGRVVACEVMVASAAIRNLIREGKTHQIYSAMQAGGRLGMQTMDQALAELVKTGKVSVETAVEHCNDEADLRRMITGVR